MISPTNIFVLTLCAAVAVPSPETYIIGPKSAGTTTSVNAVPGVSSAAGSGAASAGSQSIDTSPSQSDAQLGTSDFSGSLATGSGTAFSGRFGDVDTSGYQPQYGQVSGSYASGSGLGAAGYVNPTFGQGDGSYASANGVGIAGSFDNLGNPGVDISGIGAGTGIRDQVTGGYNPYSPFADFCYGNSNCIGGYPKGYIQGGGVGPQGLANFPQNQGSFSSGYGSGYGSSYAAPRGLENEVGLGSAYASGYGSAYSS